MQRILIHSGKHPFDPFRYDLGYERTMAVFGANSGNLLFADAVFKYLYTSEAQTLVSDGYQFPTDSAEFSAEAINEQFDAVVFPAANWLAGYYRHMLPLYAAKIRQLRIPCVILGLGAQSGADNSFDFLSRLGPEAKDFLSAVSNKCHSISVRGEFTAECLRRLGFNNVNITGCPSFYRNLQNLSVDKASVPRENFRLAVNGNKKHLTALRTELFQRYDSVLFSQGDLLRVGLDRWRTPWRDLRRVLGDGFSLDLLSSGRVRLFGDITPWIEELRRYHFSIGTRIHGNIIALLSGVPALVVAHDSRTAEMANFYRIPTIPLHSLRRGFDPYDLYQAADYTPMIAGYPDRLANMARFLEANGLQHTLFHQNGTTCYDARVRRLNFAPKGYEFGGSFFQVSRNFAAAVSGLKALHRPAANLRHA